MWYPAGSFYEFDPTAWFEHSEDFREGGFPHVDGECGEEESLVDVCECATPIGG